MQALKHLSHKYSKLLSVTSFILTFLINFTHFEGVETTLVEAGQTHLIFVLCCDFGCRNIFELSKQNKFWIGVVVSNIADLANTNSANRKQEDVNLVFEQQNI